MTCPPPPELKSAVLAALPDLGGEAWQSLPGGRTNRVWRVGPIVIKCHDPAAATPLFPNDASDEALALAMLAPLGLSPALVARGGGWLAYSHVEGQNWQGDPAPVARAFHSLHQVEPKGFRELPSGSAAILAQGRSIAEACHGTLPTPPADPGIAAVIRPVLIHGDAVPGNIILGPGGPVLIDWQCPAAGDPAEDLAMFLSPAMHWIYRGQRPDPELAARMLASYPDPVTVQRYLALAPLFRWRMAAHCLWKAERGAADYAEAMRLELEQPANPDADAGQRGT